MFVNWEANDPESGIRICEWAVGKWMFYKEFKCICLYLVFTCRTSICLLGNRVFRPPQFWHIVQIIRKLDVYNANIQKILYKSTNL